MSGPIMPGGGGGGWNWWNRGGPGGPGGTPPPGGDGGGDDGKKTQPKRETDTFELSPQTKAALVVLEKKLEDPANLAVILRDARQRVLIHYLPQQMQVAIALRLQKVLEDELNDTVSELSSDPTVLFLISLLGVSMRQSLRGLLGLAPEEPIAYDQKGKPKYRP